MNHGTALPSDNARLLGLYRLMAMTRAIDEVIGKEDGHWHGLEGEEAVVAGTYYGLRDGDIVAPHYRGSLTAACARGADLRRLLAGVLGKATSYNRGRHRSDVCGPPQFGLIGLYSGALGPPLSYATGAALAFKLDRRDNVAVGVFGDGTSSRGDCHEAMNLASSLALPVVFVCQNNQVAISTNAADRVSGRSIADRALGYRMPGIEVDGNDVIAVHDAVQTAIGRARRGGGPTLIDALTYRVAGHFISDRADPRPAAEVAAWRERDPIRAFRRWLVDNGVADAADLDRIFAEVRRETAAAMEQATADPEPGADVLGAEAVYA
jgi:TPP-dependent pyruvate/acetoin dehydrogenase alpha subunit